MKPDIIVNVRFLTPSEGGRPKPIVGAEVYSCPFFIEEEGFDCRLYLYGRTIELGKYYEIPLKFICPQFAYEKVAIGKDFELREFNIIARGTILAICSTYEVIPKCN